MNFSQYPLECGAKRKVYHSQSDVRKVLVVKGNQDARILGDRYPCPVSTHGPNFRTRSSPPPPGGGLPSRHETYPCRFACNVSAEASCGAHSYTVILGSVTYLDRSLSDFRFDKRATMHGLESFGSKRPNSKDTRMTHRLHCSFRRSLVVSWSSTRSNAVNQVLVLVLDAGSGLAVALIWI